MARSMSGGTRGFIRGKVANDLYQVTKDARGRKVQLVRAVEDSRKNNNTVMQAVARMQMALCMGCLKQFKEIVDHSWETIPYGQLSIAHFVKLNIPLLQQDCKDHWEADSQFSYPTKGVSGIRMGNFIMSEGKLATPDELSIGQQPGRYSTAALIISLDQATVTMADLKRTLGAAANDYITALVIESRLKEYNETNFMFRRVFLTDIADDIVMSVDNVGDFFRTEGTANGTITYNKTQQKVYIELANPTLPDYMQYVCTGIILSVWDGTVWRRNNCQMVTGQGVDPVDWVYSPNEVFQSWFDSYDPDHPYNPYEL